MELIPLNQDLSIAELADKIATQATFYDYQTRVTANTLRRQKADLDLFATFLDKAGLVVGDLMNDHSSWNGLTHGLVKGFVYWMGQEGYAVGSINVRLATIKTYAGLAFAAGTLSEPTYAMIKLVKGYRHKEGRNFDQKREVTRVGDKKSQAVSISPTQAAELKSQPDTSQGRRDALLMTLLLDHGLRCGEVASLAVSSLNLAEGTIQFYRPKVDMDQTHNLTKDSLLAAIRYFEVAKPVDKLLMGSRRGGKLEGEMIEQSINERVKVLVQSHETSLGKREKHWGHPKPRQGRSPGPPFPSNSRDSALGEKVGLPSLSPHDCRHYWATQAAKHKTDIVALQEAGGWSSLAMPRRYVEASKIANEGVKLQ